MTPLHPDLYIGITHRFSIIEDMTAGELQDLSVILYKRPDLEE
jgi:hypothetical protein